MYQKILLATDGSEPAKRATQKVIKLVQVGGGVKVVAFHSIKHHFLPRLTFQEYIISEADYCQFIREVEKAGHQILNEVKAMFEIAGVGVTTRLITDKEPEDYAIDLAKTEGVDLIVLGCKGHHSKLKEIFLGSVATRVLNAATCDVLIVR